LFRTVNKVILSILYAVSMSLSITVETDPRCFRELENEWLDLLQHSITNTIFQTPIFLRDWWETLSEGELYVVLMRDSENTLRGIAPLFVQQNSRGKKEVCFVGCVNVSDYLDVIVHKDFEKEVYDGLYTALSEKIEWEELFWCSVPERSPTRAFLKEHFSKAIEKVQDVSPQIVLPNSWDEYLSSLDRKQRHEVKRKMRRLDELEHEFELITEKNASEQAVEEFIQLHKSSSAKKKDFWNEEHLVFFRKLVPDAAHFSWLKLFFLRIEGKRVSTMLIFDYNNKYDLYNSGFLPDMHTEVSTGTTLTAYTIRHAIENKKAQYDFLRGGEEYKFRLGAVSQNVYDISII
jgi:CelD/BcsL family acetyltransferase involved in cellulose biosynthesis